MTCFSISQKEEDFLKGVEGLGSLKLCDQDFLKSAVVVDFLKFVVVEDFLKDDVKEEFLKTFSKVSFLRADEALGFLKTVEVDSGTAVVAEDF